MPEIAWIILPTFQNVKIVADHANYLLAFPTVVGSTELLAPNWEKKSWFIFSDQTQKRSQFNTIHT